MTPAVPPRRALLAAALLLLATACGAETGTPDDVAWWSAGAESAGAEGATGAGGVGAGSQAVAPAASALPGAPTAEQATLAPDDEPAPELAAAGSPPEQVWGQMTARHTWLYRHPDPAGLEQIYAPDCSCLAREREQLAELAAQGRWWSGERPELTGVEVRDAAAPDLLALRATYARRGDSLLVDGTGAVHQTLPARESIVIDVVLVREAASAPWLVRSLSEPFATPGVTP